MTTKQQQVNFLRALAGSSFLEADEADLLDEIADNLVAEEGEEE